MGASKDRLELKIDVLDRSAQRAMALAELTPAELIAATLQEFRDVEYLGIDVADYRLFDATTDQELNGAQPLNTQLGDGAHIRLVERERPVPSGGQRPNAAIYLRELTSGRVYRLHWLPAIVGRPDRNLRDNQLLAANLEMLPSGLRVSRRHAMIGEQDGQYFVQCLSGNPATLRRANGETSSLNTSRTPIGNGDVLYLERSEIALKFIIWDDGAAPAGAQTVEKDAVAAAAPVAAGDDDSSSSG